MKFKTFRQLQLALLVGVASLLGAHTTHAQNNGKVFIQKAAGKPAELFDDGLSPETIQQYRQYVSKPGRKKDPATLSKLVVHWERMNTVKRLLTEFDKEEAHPSLKDQLKKLERMSELLQVYKNEDQQAYREFRKERKLQMQKLGSACQRFDAIAALDALEKYSNVERDHGDWFTNFHHNHQLKELRKEIDERKNCVKMAIAAQAYRRGNGSIEPGEVIDADSLFAELNDPSQQEVRHVVK